jgi:ABC-type proline/glycine betaine transport system permease subunit
VNRVKQPVVNLKYHSLLMFALVLCFGLAAVANFIGIAGIIGAFLQGSHYRKQPMERGCISNLKR